jgi:uncharacterized protein YbbC (DUF1343 family)
VETGVLLLEEFRRAAPGEFEWREPPYEYEYSRPPIDILYGSAGLREALGAGTPAEDIAASWRPDVDRFEPIRRKFLLY